jgi:queuine tRNA-ribosyltransferase
MNNLITKHGQITFPAFMPDATYGSVKSVTFSDLKNLGISEIVTTTLHLEQTLGSKFINQLGGIHKFFGWNDTILTDSGGWQVFSLINASGKSNLGNKISEAGATFINPINGISTLLSPEISIQIQLDLGADILTVLDNPIQVNASLADQKKSVEINTKWAIRAKNYFQQKKVDSGYKLGCVVQGGDNFELRKRSASELVDIGFDLYNFGGIPMNHNDPMWKVRVQEDNKLTFFREMLHYVAEILPADSVKYAMGVGKPIDIAFCVDVGWNIFDTVLPTRNARHGLLFVSEGQGDDSFEYISKTGKRFAYDHLHLRSKRYLSDERPVDENCSCECCSNVSRAYLRHLVRIKEPAGLRLATIHNLRFYAKWMDELKSM